MGIFFSPAKIHIIFTKNKIKHETKRLFLPTILLTKCPNPNPPETNKNPTITKRGSLSDGLFY